MQLVEWRYPRVIAHRGAGLLAPENTLAAMRASVALGFRAVEFDVMLSSDGVAVLMHDAQFGRTIAGRGDVASTTAQALAAMDAGAWLGPAFAGEPVPRYVDVLHWCRAHDVWMNIEIKPSSDALARETGRIVGELTRAALADDLRHSPGGLDPALPEFSSFSIDALEAARDACPEIPRGLLVTDVPDDWRERMRHVDALALHARHRTLTRERIADIKTHGVPLMLYTVNDAARARDLFAWGVDAICTDRIDLIGATFAAR